ncbi:uncharacterized protein LOC135077908 [Ostrinia nubilalis]|uniref:uncharacterized protein LOC135077908 n=1 Tax=Ostrinia nubilalis TaxID=29057 RepID=UPI00308246A4
MQAEYPKTDPCPSWDPVRIRYPVRKFPETGESSETIGRRWRSQPETMMFGKAPIEEIKNYMRDYIITKELTQSQSMQDFGRKAPETKRFNKHTASSENEYIYPLSRRLEERVPLCSAHATSVMKTSYPPPTTPPRLVTDKDQFKHPASLPPDPLEIEPSWHKELEPLDTTHEGFEKYLDPYLTTSRLHHRPFTADQLSKLSASNDIITYYTFSEDPWIRRPKHKSEEWRLPLSKQKSIYDREKFKEGFREIRTHNNPQWVPGTFRTEARDNYRPQSVRMLSHVEHLEEDVRNYYHRLVAGLPTNAPAEYTATLKNYRSETTHMGTGRPICSALDQHVEKNIRLERRSKAR